ncbi:hypothetical protein DQ04_04961050 [Trypanosoma grayi]|uniref:hypothetical protein n=1 Tax=Trypanosoma grayi TaxID=71804 RepID=UPI0004F48B0C|nr:hypothetical protein DQ04_04961050 [Trypanosoma grayi]KEG09603.1 hypothetical protein DQ04_04961050 [Trypanosoma grayi]
MKLANISRVSNSICRKVVQHDFYDTAEQVAAVVLLNSPSNGPQEYEEYLRLLLRKRLAPESQGPSSSSHCYFVCADGAYPRLQAYVDEQHKHRLHLRPLISFPLCDAVIGDMDSYASSSGKAGIKWPLSSSYDAYATVDDIPTDVLSVVHERSRIAVAQFHTPSEGVNASPRTSQEKVFEKRSAQLSLSPLHLHVRCQMTTDFMKALLLLGRLRKQYPDTAVVVPPPVLRSPSGMQLLSTGGSLLPNASSVGSDLDDDRERKICEEASGVEALSLPTYLAIGGLGGRFDHDMAAISVMLSFQKDAHVVLTDSTNTIFACQPDGWTQVVRQPHHEGVMCSFINFGRMKECETSGLLWNVVNGRRKPSETRDLVLGFGELISACNVFRREVATIDLRRLYPKKGRQAPAKTEPKTDKCDDEEEEEEEEEDCNPPTIFTIERQCGKHG